MNAMANTVGRSGAGKPAGSNRQKIILIGLCAVLAVVLAIQLPSLLHSSSSSSSAPSDSTTATAPVASTGTETFTDTAASPGGAAVSSTAKQERAIKRMPARDPFVPLARTTSDQSTVTRPAAANPTAPATTTHVTVVPAPTIAPTAAVIVANGRRQVIGLHQEFTLGGTTFRLVSVDPKRITIAVDDGSFAGGAKQITLDRKKQLSLENAATGVRYSLVFRSATNETPTNGSTATATESPVAP